MIVNSYDKKKMLSNRKEIVLKVLMLVSVIIISIFRKPELLYTPRFFAEEGTNYFSYAFNHSWLQNLFHPQYGYITLYNSLATSFAAMFPLEVAPLVTTYLAFMVQILASCVVIWADIPGLESNYKRFAVAISIPLLSYARVWLNTLEVQYMLCVIAFLMLLNNPISKYRLAGTVRQLLLVMCGLTGVVSCFIMPAFLYKAIITKSRQFVIYTVILTICSLLQIIVFLQTYFSSNTDLTNRFIQHSAATYIGIILNSIILQFFMPFFGRGIFNISFFSTVEIAIQSVYPTLIKFGYPLMPVLIGMLVIIVLIGFMIYTAESINTQLFLLCITLVATLSTLFSINTSGGPRYTYIPSIMIVVFLVSNCNNRIIRGSLRYISIVLISSSMLFKCIEYRPIMNGFAYDDNWPSWVNEVRMWRENNKHSLKIWPPPWQMQLKKQ